MGSRGNMDSGIDKVVYSTIFEDHLERASDDALREMRAYVEGEIDKRQKARAPLLKAEQPWMPWMRKQA